MTKSGDLQHSRSAHLQTLDLLRHVHCAESRHVHCAESRHVHCAESRQTSDICLHGKIRCSCATKMMMFSNVLSFHRNMSELWNESLSKITFSTFSRCNVCKLHTFLLEVKLEANGRMQPRKPVFNQRSNSVSCLDERLRMKM